MIKKNYLIISILVVCMLAQLSLLLGTDWFQYARPEIEAGQWWRFVTGNLIHLNWRHFLMNALALVVIYLLFPNTLRPITLFLVLLLSSLAVTFGLWLFSPQVYWYVGLSGVLHGTLVVLLILDYINSKSNLNIGIMLIVVAKLLWEGFWGPLPGSESTAGGPVVVAAHFHGALGGLLIAVSFLIKKLNKNRKIA